MTETGKDQRQPSRKFLNHSSDFPVFQINFIKILYLDTCQFLCENLTNRAFQRPFFSVCVDCKNSASFRGRSLLHVSVCVWMWAQCVRAEQCIVVQGSCVVCVSLGVVCVCVCVWCGCVCGVHLSCELSGTQPFEKSKLYTGLLLACVCV